MFIDRAEGAKQGSILPHVFAVLGVCGGDTNSQKKGDEDSGKSGMSQDVTPLTS